MTVRWLAGLLVAASACRTAQAARSIAEQPPVPVVRFRNDPWAFSSYSGLDNSLQTVVRDPSTWTDLWQRIQRPFFPRPAVPAVNFAHDMVIVAALGQRASAGYDIMIEGAEQTSDGLIVDLRVTSPGSGCPVEAVMTQPVDIGRVPFSDGPVRFREHQVVVACDTR